MEKDWLRALVDHLAIREEPNSYGIFLNREENISNFMNERIKTATGIPEEENDFERRLRFGVFTGEEFDTPHTKVENWINDVENGHRNRRKVIYVPLGSQIRDNELISILIGAKDFIEGLSIDKGQMLIVLFVLERSSPWVFRIIPRIHNKCRKELTKHRISLLRMPSKVGNDDIDKWLNRLNSLCQKFHFSDLCRRFRLDELEAVCRRKFPARKKWYYEELREPHKEVLIKARFE